MRKLLQNHKTSESLIETVHFTDRETEAQKGIFPEQKCNDVPRAFICREA